MVKQQNTESDNIDMGPKLSLGQKDILGGQILKMALAYDALTARGKKGVDAIDELKSEPNKYTPALV